MRERKGGTFHFGNVPALAPTKYSGKRHVSFLHIPQIPASFPLPTTTPGSSNPANASNCPPMAPITRSIAPPTSSPWTGSRQSRRLISHHSQTTLTSQSRVTFHGNDSALPRTGIFELELNICWVSSEPPGIHISASIQDCFTVIAIFTDLKLTVSQTQAFPRVLLKSPELLIQPFFSQKDSRFCGMDGVGGIT
ncbi:hypothetical protein B0H13DRAFT_1899235 [Mycena leptocephala]|nr:hypothetical protein B0H13DRAFT_1899235 [Mycena leptocephala]